MFLVYNLIKFTPPPPPLVCRVLTCRVHTAISLLEKNNISFSQLMQEEPSEPSSNKRQSLFMRRKLHEGLNKTLNIFRDLDPKYSFLKISPPVPNIDVQQISSSFWLKFASHTQDKLDLLEAWHLMATQSRLEEEEEEDEESSLVRSHQEEQIILKIIRHFPDYSYHQLSQLTFNLEILRSRAQLKKQFTRSLHFHLTRKMREIIMTEDCRPEEIDQCLSVSFILLRADIEYNIDPATGRREHRLRGGHNSALLELLLGHHLSSLSPTQLVYCLFLAGVQKEYPGCGYRAEGQGFPLPARLYDKLASVLAELSPHEVGVVCHSLHQVHLHLQTKHSAVRQAALNCLLAYPDSLIQKDQFVVGSVAKFLMKRGSENHQHVVRLMEKYRPHLHNMDAMNSIRLLQLILSGKTSPKQSRPFIEALCQSLEHRLVDMRLKDLEKLAFGLFFLNHHDINRNMRGKLAQAMLQCNWSDVKSGKSFLFIVNFLAKMGEFEIDSINKIISEANKNKHNMMNLDTDLGLAKAIGFLFELNIPFVREVNTKYVLKFVQGNRVLCRNSLFCLLELDCLMELYRIDCQRLDGELRSTLTKFFHSQPDFEFLSSSEEYMDDNGQISTGTFNEQTKGFIHRDLVNILGDERFVWSGHPFPHSSSSIILIRRNKKGTFKMFPNTFQTFSQSSLESVVEDEDDFTAILIPSKSQTDLKGTAYGPLERKIEHLKLLGYKPLVIFWPVYYKMFKEKKNLKFLRNTIKYKLK